MTSIQFERLLSTSSPTQGLPVRVSDGKKMEKIAFIQCVGSRDPLRPGSLFHHLLHVCDQAGDDCQRQVPGSWSDRLLHGYTTDGKDYERYYERAKTGYGIEYIGVPSPRSKNFSRRRTF